MSDTESPLSNASPKEIGTAAAQLIRDAVLFILKVWVAVGILLGILFAMGTALGVGFRVVPLVGRSILVFVLP